ncbi:MAG: glycosyltransferase [Pseudomonadota bacterium]
MIFLTVGTQLPFDRLVTAVDDWAGATGQQVFGQISDLGPENYRPRHIEWVARLAPEEFEARYEAAPAVVAHAGMGTIIGALTRGKPLLIMPRRADLGEQRNDHQIATADRFGTRPGIAVANEAEDVAPALDALGQKATAPSLGPSAEDTLIAAIRSTILPSGG